MSEEGESEQHTTKRLNGREKNKQNKKKKREIIIIYIEPTFNEMAKGLNQYLNASTERESKYLSRSAIFCSRV